MSPTVRIIVYASGIVLGTIGTTYQAHGDAPVMAYVAASATALGTYLIGLFQSPPWNGQDRRNGRHSSQEGSHAPTQ